MADINYPEAIRLAKEKLANFAELHQATLKQTTSDAVKYSDTLTKISADAIHTDNQQRHLDNQLREFENNLPQIIKQELKGFPPTAEPTPEEPAPPPPKGIRPS